MVPYVMYLTSLLKLFILVRQVRLVLTCDHSLQLERQLAILTTEARREEVMRKRAEMAEKEERLFFFDREREYELAKTEKLERWRRTLPKWTWGSRITLKKKEEVAKDDYVPPTVR